MLFVSRYKELHWKKFQKINLELIICKGLNKFPFFDDLIVFVSEP